MLQINFAQKILEEFAKIVEQDGISGFLRFIDKYMEDSLFIRSKQKQGYGKTIMQKDNSELVISDNEAINRFSQLSYDREVWAKTKWMGREIFKYPTDMIIYQEIIHAVKPDLIIETGTWAGGSALYMAHLLDIIGKGNIISVDNEWRCPFPQHPRITYLKGSSVDNIIVDKIYEKVKDLASVLVILDSDHSRTHVSNELNIYHKFVTLNSYIIVEDTNLRTVRNNNNGPLDAVEDFLKTNNNFIQEIGMERFFLTSNPGGYLKRAH